ncbi:hypothetical protein GYMLUDRAFT_916113 [Collybiopsis luxurians FD-317 M1]|uniref:Uncharacterized protein n=1 Tax=Collybiopsis luxurians FD-317 M1 TaxID=944289 RepID=A0A0D0BHG7_9AGAR|nr:hypothetical protein GYMLUDRAFT_916113 [Collybiopsis luxurians FD-317 M1]
MFGCEHTWRMKTEMELGLGEILSCGLAEIRDKKGKIRRGHSCLYHILVSDSAHLIWKLNNNYIINHKDSSWSRKYRI